ncbi:unnamed protein product [Nippostrongylus brasiliensis]|uniref:Uncharacterized protein n=1 Tax=Nippostrongylus brasiliensis TaxID=27835 RepID=A0A0N4YG16_NIPBR|nr:hypothetical protein Q1695_001636 [Nippostrongylus brasiliensis]VDL79324.1 unnamed protein product [Nippostrongylus brasiliensis]
MLRHLFLALLAVFVAALVADARILDEPNFLSSRMYADDLYHLVRYNVPRRTIRQAMENQPLPCRFKLCVSFY